MLVVLVGPIYGWDTCVCAFFNLLNTKKYFVASYCYRIDRRHAHTQIMAHRTSIIVRFESYSIRFVPRADLFDPPAHDYATLAGHIRSNSSICLDPNSLALSSVLDVNFINERYKVSHFRFTNSLQPNKLENISFDITTLNK